MPGGLRISTSRPAHVAESATNSPSKSPSSTPKSAPGGKLGGLSSIASPAGAPRAPRRSSTLPVAGKYGGAIGGASPAGHAPKAPATMQPDRAPRKPLDGDPQSPSTSARRLFKAARADPRSTVTDGLGPKSSSHPNLPLDKGGGFNVTTEQKRKLTPAEIDADYQKKKAGYDKAMAADPNSKRKPPQPLDPNKEKTFFKGQLEYHPAGGIHSNYPGEVNHSEGGSYLRTRQEVPSGGEQRYGRHGPFDSRATFDHQPLKGKGKIVTNPQPAPNRSDSPPPSPNTGSQIMDGVHRDPTKAMAELASGKPYPEVAAALRPTPHADEV